MLGARAVDVEEEGWVRGCGGEGGEVQGLLVPVGWVAVGCVVGAEPVREVWVVVDVARGEGSVGIGGCLGMLGWIGADWSSLECWGSVPEG